MTRHKIRIAAALAGLIIGGALLITPVIRSVRVLLPPGVQETTVRRGASWAAGTLIPTPEGMKPVEEIPGGSSIFALDTDGRRVATAVTSVVVRETPGNLVRLSGTEFDLTVTAEHLLRVVGDAGADRAVPGPPVLRDDRGIWIAANTLRVGDRLISEGGVVEIDRAEPHEERLLVYNFVTAAGAYIAGAPGILTADAGWAASLPDTAGEGLSYGGCFPAGTPVLTPDGPVAIETLRPGDQVMSRHPESGRWAPRIVLRTTSQAWNDVTVVWKTDTAEVTATANHPVFVNDTNLPAVHSHPRDVPSGEGRPLDGLWVEAAGLRPGDLLATPEGTESVVSVGPGPVVPTVYNLTVAGWHSYAVGSEGFLVHNKGEEDSGEDFDSMGKSEAEAPERALRGSETGPSDAPMWDEESAAEPSAAAPGRDGPSGLRAGFADDNKQYSYFLNFLEQYGPAVPHEELAVGERIVVQVVDSDGRSIPDAVATVLSDRREVARGITLADGTWTFFPAETDADPARYILRVEALGERREIGLFRDGPRTVTVTIDAPRRDYQAVPMDILFVLDTTGSMGEEIDRLRKTIEIIHLNLISLPARPAVRFGMVLYKDRGDEYLTKSVPLTADVDEFRSFLEQVTASGGGDSPEDLEAALDSAIRRTDWTPEGIRMVFIITDAAPHLDYPTQAYSYDHAARDAREKGIKIHAVGTGGLPLAGEYVLRQIAQYTGGRYIFLTYGETGESGGGAPGSVSHHTGANWTAENLETIIIRFAKEELSYLTDEPLGDDPDWWSAVPGDRPASDILEELFALSLNQLLDFSARRVDGTVAALLPFEAADPADDAAAEYLGARALLTLRNNPEISKRLVLTERTDIQDVLDELEIQLSGLTAEEGAARIGELLGAEVLITGTLHRRGDDAELFVRLIRTQTAEILSVTRVVADRRLLP